MTKALKELCDSGDVVERISGTVKTDRRCCPANMAVGKAAVYHMVQDPKDTISEEEIKASQQCAHTIYLDLSDFNRNTRPKLRP